MKIYEMYKRAVKSVS